MNDKNIEVETDHKLSKTETEPFLPDQSLKGSFWKCFKGEEEYHLGTYHSNEGQRFINLSGKCVESGQIETEHLGRASERGVGVGSILGRGVTATLESVAEQPLPKWELSLPQPARGLGGQTQMPRPLVKKRVCCIVKEWNARFVRIKENLITT